jgi:hypothetical protein
MADTYRAPDGRRIYAPSHLTGFSLFDFKCVWFNEHQHCEFLSCTIPQGGAIKLPLNRCHLTSRVSNCSMCHRQGMA